VRVVALCIDLLIGRATAAGNAPAVRVLVRYRGLETGRRALQARAVGTFKRAHVAHALHLPGAPVSRLPRRTLLADKHTSVVSKHVLWTLGAISILSKILEGSCRTELTHWNTWPAIWPLKSTVAFSFVFRIHLIISID